MSIINNDSHVPPVSGVETRLDESAIETQEQIIKLREELAQLEASASIKGIVVEKDQPSVNELAMLAEMGQKITSNLRKEDIFKNIYLCLNNLMDAAVVELGIFNSKTEIYDYFSNLKSDNSQYKNELADWCIDNKRDAVVQDLQTDYQRYIYEPVLARDGREPKSAICFPMLVSDRCVGVVCVMSFRKSAFTDYHANIIRSLLSYTAVAIDNASIYEELKNAQTQLIHQEKLASLGQLTAGIAHEIQNPLNFVNNFAKLSSGMVAELKEELDRIKGNVLGTEDMKYIDEIMSDLNSNCDKISHHGTRADSIVKGMLSHSRLQRGEKMQTDLNALAEEYMNLAYHGLRGKDSNFNCELLKELPPGLPNPILEYQDIGRVLLNLFTNAFYAVNERRKKMPSSYQPSVTVSSALENKMIVVSISDNGGGIPRGIIDKIFNPFFTTKPAGEGTGLGLSLSIDIIRGQGGVLDLETKEGEGTTFHIRFPLNS